jgi:hypothetical protein
LPSSSYKLDVNGAVQATSYNATSDERLKENILPISDPLEKILKIQGVNYNWKNGDNKNVQSGVVAQEVEPIIPEVVTTSIDGNEDGFHQKSVNYSGLVPYLIESIKELSSQNDSMKHDIENLKTKNEELTEKMIKYDLMITEILKNKEE